MHFVFVVESQAYVCFNVVDCWYHAFYHTEIRARNRQKSVKLSCAPLKPLQRVLILKKALSHVPLFHMCILKGLSYCTFYL